MAVLIYDPDGRVVRRSRNLRGLREHAAKQPVRTVALGTLPDGRGRLLVVFANGDRCEETFACPAALRQFVQNWRKAHGAQLLVEGEDEGALERNHPALRRRPWAEALASSGKA